MNNSEGNYVFVRKVAIKSVNLPVNVLMVQNFWPVFEQTLGMGRAQAYDTIKMRWTDNVSVTLVWIIYKSWHLSQ